MQVSIKYLRRLEKCGRGELHPALCVPCGQGQYYAEKLSLKDQTRVINEGIWWPEGDTHRLRPLSELSLDEAKAALQGGVIADLETIKARYAVAVQRRRFRSMAHEEIMKKYDADQEASAAIIDKAGFRLKGETVILPDGTRVPGRALLDWLYRCGF